MIRTLGKFFDVALQLLEIYQRAKLKRELIGEITLESRQAYQQAREKAYEVRMDIPSADRDRAIERM